MLSILRHLEICFFSNFADMHGAGSDWCGSKRQGSKALPSESHLQRLTFISLKTTKIQEQILEEGTAAHLIVSTTYVHPPMLFLFL